MPEVPPFPLGSPVCTAATDPRVQQGLSELVPSVTPTADHIPVRRLVLDFLSQGLWPQASRALPSLFSFLTNSAVCGFSGDHRNPHPPSTGLAQVT